MSSADRKYQLGGPLITRRATTIALGIAALTAGPISAIGASSTVTARKGLLDPANPEDARAIYRKLRYRTNSGLLFSWVKGPYMAAIDGNLVPMYGINLGSISRVTQRADGGFDLRDLEISFRVDVETGRRLTSFHNPITNEILPVVVRPQGPNVLNYTRDNDGHINDVPGGARFDMKHFPPSPFVLGDEIYIRDRSHATVTMADGSTSMLNEVSTISAPRSQVLDPTSVTVETRVQSNDVRSWPAWLNMGNRQGTLGLYGNGAKVQRFSDLPQDWLAMLHEELPEIATDPVAALDRTPPRPA